MGLTIAADTVRILCAALIAVLGMGLYLFARHVRPGMLIRKRPFVIVGFGLAAVLLHFDLTAEILSRTESYYGSRGWVGLALLAAVCSGIALWESRRLARSLAEALEETANDAS